MIVTNTPSALTLFQALNVVVNIHSSTKAPTTPSAVSVSSMNVSIQMQITAMRMLNALILMKDLAVFATRDSLTTLPIRVNLEESAWVGDKVYPDKG